MGGQNPEDPSPIVGEPSLQAEKPVPLVQQSAKQGLWSEEIGALLASMKEHPCSFKSIRLEPNHMPLLTPFLVSTK